MQNRYLKMAGISLLVVGKTSILSTSRFLEIDVREQQSLKIV